MAITTISDDVKRYIRQAVRAKCEDKLSEQKKRINEGHDYIESLRNKAHEALLDAVDKIQEKLGDELRIEYDKDSPFCSAEFDFRVRTDIISNLRKLEYEYDEEETELFDANYFKIIAALEMGGDIDTVEKMLSEI